MHMPKTLAKEYEIKVFLANGEEVHFKEKENKKRNVLLLVESEIVEVSLTILQNWGNKETTKLFTFEVY